MSAAGAEHAFGKSDEVFREVRRAALDRAPVSGLTHTFYRYPARFSPQFAGAAIEAFSRPGDLVLDPYMGGATTIVEAIARGRQAVGCDLNLSPCLSHAPRLPSCQWQTETRLDSGQIGSARFSYWFTPDDLDRFICAHRTQNLTLPSARPIKKGNLPWRFALSRVCLSRQRPLPDARS